MIERKLEADPLLAILVKTLDIGRVNSRSLGARVEFRLSDDIPRIKADAFQPPQLQRVARKRQRRQLGQENQTSEKTVPASSQHQVHVLFCLSEGS